MEEVNREGKDFGVTLAWFPVINLNKFVTTGARGLVVFVHNTTFKPNEGVFIEAGKMTYISVKRKIKQKYPSPYSDCIDLNTYKSDLFDYIKKSNKSYRRKDCIELCIQKKIIDECKCYFTAYDDMKTDARPCLSLSDLGCLEESYDNFTLETYQRNSVPFLAPFSCRYICLIFSTLGFNGSDKIGLRFSISLSLSSDSFFDTISSFFTPPPP